MSRTASPPDPAIREIPLSSLSLAPENVRKTPADESAQNQLTASIRAHGLLENLVARADGTDDEGNKRFAVVAGGRRLAALNALAEEGALDADYAVPCRLAPDGDGSELSLAENVVRVAMHPADQVTAFAELAESGASVASIAARFGVSEHLVEQRLRLGNAAPEILDAYRAGEIGLEALKAFAVTTDHERQRAVWEHLAAQEYGRSVYQVKRLLTEERVPANAALARFVGIDAYEAAGGAVLRDLFADEHENGVWLEDPDLLNELAMKRLTAAADELGARWKWAEALPEVDWNVTARYGRVHPQPGQPTDKEAEELEQLRMRHDELTNLDDDEWTEELETEAGAVMERIEAIEAAVQGRARFRREDFAIAGCIATVGHDGSLKVIHGLVKPEDLPKSEEAPGAANGRDPDAEPAAAHGPVDGPAVSTPLEKPRDPTAQARQEAGVGISLGDDLRAIRTALVKAHLAGDFEAAFDLSLFQMARSVFAQGRMGADHALEIAFRETPDRPTPRGNDADFADWSPGEAMLADVSDIPLDWMQAKGDAARFAALRALPRADKEKLFAAAVARTVKGQLAFEHDARPELEATIARLDIDFARHVRPTAALLWSRLRKDRIFGIARETLGAAWTAARAKYKKADLARAMEEAFAAGPTPVGIGADEHAAALAWVPPGFAAFDGGRDAGGENAPEAAEADEPAASAGDANGEATRDSNGTTAQSGGPDANESAGNGQDGSARNGNGAAPAPANATGPAEEPVSEVQPADAGEASDVPEFLRRVQ